MRYIIGNKEEHRDKEYWIVNKWKKGEIINERVHLSKRKYMHTWAIEK